MEPAISATRCPRCTRPNAPTAWRCLYCGEHLAGSQPHAGERQLPADLDRLVRQALKGDPRASLSKLQAALESIPAPPARPLPRAVSHPAPVHEPPPLVAPRPPDPAEKLQALVADARSAQSAWAMGDGAETRLNLARVRTTLRELEGLIGGISRERPEPPPPAQDADADWGEEEVTDPGRSAPAATAPLSAAEATLLPRQPQPWLLLVEGPGDAERAGPLAEALRVDRVTAQQLSLTRYPRIAARGEEPGPLVDLATRVRQIAGLGAVVCPADGLAALPIARCVLRVGVGGGLELSDRGLWREEASGDLSGEEDPADDLSLVVPGEIVLSRFRGRPDPGRGRKGRVISASGSSRVAVVDLHGPRCMLRLIQGVSDLRGLPGHEEGSSLRSLRALVEQAHQRWPRAVVLGSRTVKSSHIPTEAELDLSGAAVVDAWPLWEEHSRLCRLMAGLGPARKAR